MTGARGARWTGTGDGGQRPFRPRPRKPGLKLSLRDDDSLWREPWWNADRRAAPLGGAAPDGAAGRTSVCRRSASLFIRRAKVPAFGLIERNRASVARNRGTTPFVFPSAFRFS